MCWCVTHIESILNPYRWYQIVLDEMPLKGTPWQTKKCHEQYLWDNLLNGLLLLIQFVYPKFTDPFSWLQNAWQFVELHLLEAFSQRDAVVQHQLWDRQLCFHQGKPLGCGRMEKKVYTTVTSITHLITYKNPMYYHIS